MQAGYSWEWIENQQVLELVRVWFSVLRRKNFDNALTWYESTLARIYREAREMIGTGKHKRQPTEAQIKLKEAQLKQRYFRTVSGEDWEQLKKRSYYHHVTATREFLKKYKEQEQRKKNDKLKKNK